jgi:hypothetical protein
MVSKRRVRGEERRRGGSSTAGQDREMGQRRRFTPVRKPREGRRASWRGFLEAKIGFKIAILFETDEKFESRIPSEFTLFDTKCTVNPLVIILDVSIDRTI